MKGEYSANSVSPEIQALGPPSLVLDNRQVLMHWTGMILFVGIMVLLGGAGGFLAVLSADNPGWTPAVPRTPVLALLLLTAIVLLPMIVAPAIAWVWASLRRKLYICPAGFYCEAGKANVTMAFAWDNITFVNESVRFFYWSTVELSLRHPFRKRHKYVIGNDDRDSLTLRSDLIERLDVLGELLRRQARLKDFPWTTVERHSIVSANN